ncbi:MAG TPA: rod shape-determining protein RodA [Anaerolineae bacterium]|nr:rod shape-determining protein RodA [Anaerolineae bacterium]
MRSISWRYFDFWLLGTVIVLTIFGITMIRSAIAGNIELINQNTVQKQIIFGIAGLFVLMLMAAIDYRLLSAISKFLYVGIILLLVILILFGDSLFGSARWFRLGPILIQPSELSKIVVIIVLSDYFAHSQGEAHDIKWLLKSLIIVFGLAIWILLQPDLSTSIVIFAIWFAMIWIAGLQIKHLLIASGIGVFGGGLGLLYLLTNYDPNQESGLIKPYQVERIINFFFPNPNATHGAIYNVQQALVSIGSGGWFGKGYGSGSQVQLRFLKVRHSDFIFSALSEEFGFVGTVIVIALLLFVILRCIHVARISSDTFGALLSYGVATLIAFQAIVNIGMNLNLLPVTGLTLPFISYGGSSLLSNLLGIGIVESVALRQKSLEF